MGIFPQRGRAIGCKPCWTRPIEGRRGVGGLKVSKPVRVSPLQLLRGRRNNIAVNQGGTAEPSVLEARRLFFISVRSDLREVGE